MRKINVLEIEYKEVFNGDYAVKIKYQNEDVLKRGEFEDEEIGVKSVNCPEFDKRTLFVCGKNTDKDNRYNIVSSKKLEEIKSKIKKINEKYGIKPRWIGEYGEEYYYVTDKFGVEVDVEQRTYLDKYRYGLGNYFKTFEEAKEKADKIISIFKGECR